MQCSRNLERTATENGYKRDTADQSNKARESILSTVNKRA